MAEANDLYGSIYRNLLDADCDQQITEQGMSYVKNGNHLFETEWLFPPFYTDFGKILSHFKREEGIG